MVASNGSKDVTQVEECSSSCIVDIFVLILTFYLHFAGANWNGGQEKLLHNKEIQTRKSKLIVRIFSFVSYWSSQCHMLKFYLSIGPNKDLCYYVVSQARIYLTQWSRNSIVVCSILQGFPAPINNSRQDFHLASA